MTWRKAHGEAARLGAVVVVEGLPASELPVGVPDPSRPVAARDSAGLLQPSPGTTALAREGGRRSAEARKLRRLLGLADFPEDHPYQGYHALARELRDDHAEQVAATIGGGQLSPGVSSIIASASLALAASRYLYDLGADRGDPTLLGQAARLADQSRTSLLTAHELAAREAAAREQDDTADLRRRQAEFQRQLAARVASTASTTTTDPKEPSR